MPTAAFTLTTPLPPADLRFDSLVFSSALSQLEEMQLEMLSERPDLHPEDLLGHPVDVAIELRDGSQRHFGGYVSRFGMGKHQGRYYGYHATVVSWLWFLTRKSDCRIFQELDVKEIVTKIFEGHAAIASYEWKTTRVYRKRSYCVQYRETDYNFVARLLEDEGIYWYFEHTDGPPKLILVDMASAHAAVPGFEELPYYANLGQQSPDIDYVTDWNFSREVRSGKVALTSYNFEKPGTDLKVALALQRSYELSDYELFDFQGDYMQSSDGEQLSDNRMDEVQARFEQLTGSTNAYGLATGHLFSLTRHPRGDQNAEFLVTQTHVSAQLGTEETGRDTDFKCTFSAMPSSQQFRPIRRTPKPFVQGPQSAVVTGASGDEICTDAHGRVKVKFFWDRHGKKDDTSSCWLRVSHPWAGKSFGMIHIPRVGQEVIVDFLEGDPDQPLVTGRVYNADQTPPWTLPGNATQSGILTRSSKGGAYGNANALRFEDKKGAEQVWIQAERNMDTMVENDQSCTVGHDQTNLIRNKQKTNVMKGREVYVEDGGETYYVKGDKRTVFVKGKQVQTVTNGYDTIVTNERGEYTDGNRKCWTSGFYQFKSTKAFFDVGPLLYVQGTDFKFKSSAAMYFEAGADINMKAANFKFAATGNFDFSGNKFNRTIFEGNDTVLGPNTNTYIGVSRETVMGPATEVYSGMKNSAAAGIAIEGFLGMQVSNFLGLTLSNAVSLAIENAGINMGITAVDLTMAGIGLDNNGFKMFNCGGGAGAGSASLTAGPTVVALMAAAAGGGFALGFGGAGTMDARSQGENDVETLLNDPDLTPAVKARLREALDSRFTHPTAEQYGDTIPAGEIKAQTSSLAEDTPGAGSPPLPGLEGPPTTAEPSPGAP
jgi:type VI secretion system secreted protein VgrG